MQYLAHLSISIGLFLVALFGSVFGVHFSSPTQSTIPVVSVAKSSASAYTQLSDGFYYPNGVDVNTLVRLTSTAAPKALYHYSKDKNRVYGEEKGAYYGVIPGVDTPTFTVLLTQIFNDPSCTPGEASCALNVVITKDKNRVYSDNNVINGADPRTFTTLKDPSGGNSIFGKDNMRIFSLVDGTVLRSADYATFEVVSDIQAKDSKHTYLGKQGSVQVH